MQHQKPHSCSLLCCRSSRRLTEVLRNGVMLNFGAWALCTGREKRTQEHYRLIGGHAIIAPFLKRSAGGWTRPYAGDVAKEGKLGDISLQSVRNGRAGGKWRGIGKYNGGKWNPQKQESRQITHLLGNGMFAEVVLEHQSGSSQARSRDAFPSFPSFFLVSFLPPLSSFLCPSHPMVAIV